MLLYSISSLFGTLLPSFCRLSGDSDPCRSPWLGLHLRVIQLLQLKLLTLEKPLLKRAVTQASFYRIRKQLSRGRNTLEFLAH